MSLPKETNVQDHLYKAFDHVAEARKTLGNSLDIARIKNRKGVSNEILQDVFYHLTMAFMHLENFESEASQHMVHVRGKPYLLYRDLFEEVSGLLKGIDT